MMHTHRRHQTTPQTDIHLFINPCRFCRGDDNAEVLIPIWHFWELHYSRSFLATMDSTNRRWPWEVREKQLFSVPGGYHRHTSHPQNQKKAANGSEVLFVREELA
jgi:hypothetical protein